MRPSLAAGLAASLAALPAAGVATGAGAEEVRFARQYGLPYLPLTVMDQQGYLVARGKERGLDLVPRLTTFTGGAAMNEALISGNLDFASGGLAPMLVVWNRTATAMRVKGVAALDAMPIFLNTSNPAVHGVKDFAATDRIAVPAARVSANAIVLEMAAAQAFGEAGWNRLEAQTVSMANPDATASLVNGTAGITAHFAPEPYASQELKDPKIHRVLTSRDVVGDTYGFYAWATSAYAAAHPATVAAFIAALGDADRYIASHSMDAARIWVASEHSSVSADEIARIIAAPENVWSSAPPDVGPVVRFMARTGLLHDPVGTDVFFPRAEGGPQR